MKYHDFFIVGISSPLAHDGAFVNYGDLEKSDRNLCRFRFSVLLKKIDVAVFLFSKMRVKMLNCL